MAIYSHSKVSTFEQCPYKYKLRYIDKVKVEIPTTIEAFMGNMIHKVLEKLYKDLGYQKILSLEDLVKYYRQIWDKNYSSDILIVKEDLNSENYFNMGLKFIADYYEKYKPFNQMTILGLETKDKMILPDGNFWHVRIDKFACDEFGNYYVIDYKTNSRMKDQLEADTDRQLAMYSIWVKDKFADVKSVKLVWHMLAFNKEVVSERNDKELEELQNNIVKIIKKINETKEFPTKVSSLCPYCEYKSLCPSFKHEIELERISEVKKMKDNDGLKIVDEFATIRFKKKMLEEKEEALRLKLIEFAKQKGLDVVYGSNMKANVKISKKAVFPEDKSEIINLLKEKGILEEFITLNYSKFNSKFKKGELEEEILKKIDVGEDSRVSLSKRKEF